MVSLATSAVSECQEKVVRREVNEDCCALTFQIEKYEVSLRQEMERLPVDINVELVFMREMRRCSHSLHVY